MKTKPRHLPWISFIFSTEVSQEAFVSHLYWWGVPRARSVQTQVHLVAGASPPQYRFRVWMPLNSTVPNWWKRKPSTRNQQEIYRSTKSKDTEGLAASCLQERLRIPLKEKPEEGVGGGGMGVGVVSCVIRRKKPDCSGEFEVGQVGRDREAKKWRMKAVTCGATRSSPAPRNCNKNRGLKPPKYAMKTQGWASSCQPGTHHPRFSSWRGTPWSETAPVLPGSARSGPRLGKDRRERTGLWSVRDGGADEQEKAGSPDRTRGGRVSPKPAAAELPELRWPRTKALFGEVTSRRRLRGLRVRLRTAVPEAAAAALTSDAARSSLLPGGWGVSSAKLALVQASWRPRVVLVGF